MGSGQSFNAGRLGNGTGIGSALPLQFVNLFDDFGVGGDVADSPTCHCVAFGYAIYYHAIILYLFTERGQACMAEPIEYDPLINFVRNHEQIIFQRTLRNRF